MIRVNRSGPWMASLAGLILAFTSSNALAQHGGGHMGGGFGGGHMGGGFGGHMGGGYMGGGHMGGGHMGGGYWGGPVHGGGGYVHHGYGGYGGYSRYYGPYGGLGLLGFGPFGYGLGYGGYGLGYGGYGLGYGGYGLGYGYGYDSPTYYSSGYFVAPSPTVTQPASPYLTDQTYEPGDGYRYPLYYDPNTGQYFYYPVAR